MFQEKEEGNQNNSVSWESEEKDLLFIGRKI